MPPGHETAHRFGWMIAMLCVTSTALAQVPVVRDGRACAVVVTAVKPSPVAVYAVEEFVDHIEKATGQRLPVVAETNIPNGYDGRIFVGETEAARKVGIDVNTLALEQSVLRTVGSDLYIIGKELQPNEYKGSRPHAEPWNPLSTECEHSGTLFGVYDVLDGYVGVRWLWPGELGTYVPRTNTIEIPVLDESIKPKLLYRNVGGWDLMQIGLTGSKYGKKVPLDFSCGNLTEELVRNLVFPTEDAGFEYGRAMDVFHRRHHRVTPIENRPAVLGSHEVAGIADWWAKYGNMHPEWFAMREDGERGLQTPREGAYTALCVSNPELHHFIVEKAWDGGDVLSLGEADVAGAGMCHFPNCMAWDEAQAEGYPEILRESKYTPRAMGARYARYWKAVYDLAVKRNPNVKISVYLYHNTLPAPLEKIQLNKNISGEFVIYGSWDGWYPMSDDEDRWNREQWLGWANTGMSLVYGPNYLLNNYVTPNITTRQSGEFFRFAFQHAMVGAYFRSYTFSWAAHGPMAYMHHRLLWRPEMEIVAIRQEYFSAFGPAAADVKAYFDYWEEYARTRPSISSVSSGDPYGALEKLRRIRGHYLAYPPEAYRPARAILDKALAAARNDPQPEFAKRVEFLQVGVTHALLASRIHDFIDYQSPMADRGSAPTDPEKLKQARQAVAELIKFRQDPNNRFVSDYISNASVEKDYIRNIEVLFDSREKSGEYIKQDETY